MNSRRYSRLSRPVGYDAAEGENHPMLLHGAGVATIAAACTSGVNALALSVIMLLLCVAMSVIYMYERGEYIQPMRSVVYFVPSALLACGCGLLLNAVAPSASAAIGLYLCHYPFSAGARLARSGACRRRTGKEAFRFV